jgi:hypothetical protein
MELVFPGPTQEAELKSSHALILLIFLALGLGQMPDSSRAELSSANVVATSDSLPERAITILMPELQAKAAGVDSSADAHDLYRTVSVARGYLKLGLYDDAATWYNKLERLDGGGLFAESLLDGKMTIAASSGEIEGVLALMDEYGGRVEKTDGEQLLKAFEQICRNGQWQLVETLISKNMKIFGKKPPADLLYLQGRALRRQNRLAEAVFHFEAQINSLKVPASVHPSLVEQAPRFLQAAADCSFLINDRLRARQLYQQLLKAKDPSYQSWARFQVAQLNMLANAYELAETGYRTVAADSTGWIIEEWAAELAAHCANMSLQRKYYITINPQPMAALPEEK